jgi:hypothetical protein
MKFDVNPVKGQFQRIIDRNSPEMCILLYKLLPMIMIAGFLFVAAGLWMYIILLRNARRPRQEVRIENVVLDFMRTDRQKKGPKMPHALVKFNYDGTHYETKVFLKMREKAEGDWIEISINPDNPSVCDIYAPEKERRAIFTVIAIGVFLVGSSWWILDYLGAW